jgi:hypothetical protein
MDTYQLRDVLIRGLCPSFEGVYPRDLLPETLDQKAILINTDLYDQPGVHWVCVYLNSPVVEYLDSYGLPLPIVTFKTLLLATEKLFITPTCIKI